MKQNDDTLMRRTLITLALLVLITLGIIPENYQAQTQCPNATEVRFPFDASKMFMEQLRYIARDVESEGGEIIVDSRLGEGAVFRFTWPVVSKGG